MEKPNIVLIVMDAVRAQNVSLYGYERETTPNLKEISRRCAVYKNTISTSYWTFPSYASTFTGTYVSKHGLVIAGDVLDNNFVTIAEMLRRYGYKTIGVCPSPFVSKLSGLHRGFEIFVDPFYTGFQSKMYNFVNKILPQAREKVMRTAPKKDFLRRERFLTPQSESFRRQGALKRVRGLTKRGFWTFTGLFDKYARATNNQAFKLIERVKRQPFFLFIHYNETHTPYILPNSYRKKFLRSVPEKRPWDVNQDFFEHYSGGAKIRELDSRVMIALYDGAINYLDARIFEIYSFLSKKELLDNTMLIITSDHGDGFGEHGIRFHFFCLYDFLIRVPLIIKYPINLGFCGVENRIVQNVDILPTIMDVLRIDDRKLLNQIQGNSLVSSNISKRDHSYAISELVEPFGLRMQILREKLKKYDRQLISIRTENKKYIYTTDGNHEFYDLENDPGETNNLIDSKSPIIEELREKLKPWLPAFHHYCRKIQSKNSRERERTEFETEIRQRLKNLGYL